MLASQPLPFRRKTALACVCTVWVCCGQMAAAAPADPPPPPPANDNQATQPLTASELRLLLDYLREQDPSFNQVADEVLTDYLRSLPLATVQYQLGQAFYLGRGVKQDWSAAVTWWRKAADQGHAEAQYNLGKAFEEGKGVKQDWSAAVHWWRKAAAQGLADAQHQLGEAFYLGRGVKQDSSAAVHWWRKAADQGLAEAQYRLGEAFGLGEGVEQDWSAAFHWWRKAADQGLAEAQCQLFKCYFWGWGVAPNPAEAIRWLAASAQQHYRGAVSTMFALTVLATLDSVEAVPVPTNCYPQLVEFWRKQAEQGDPQGIRWLADFYEGGKVAAKDVAKATRLYRLLAEQGDSRAQSQLGVAYTFGGGVPKNLVESYMWYNLAAAQGDRFAADMRDRVALQMTPDQIAEAQRRSTAFVPRKVTPQQIRDALAGSDTPRRAAASGTGFFVTDDGYLLTSYHVVADALRITVSTGDQELPATLLKADTANDVALLKVDGTFRPLAITPSRTAKLGDPVFTIGFPNIDLQGLAPKLTKGEISSLTGAHDDPRHFQISVAVQPGNSGGPLVDRHGNVIGLVQARLSDLATLKSTGALPQNVNYALKSAVLSLLLESLPELSTRLKAPTTRDTPFAVIAQQAQEATVLVLAY